MYELERTDNVSRLIELTKSNSGVSGPELAQAHFQLGKILAQHMDFPADNTTVVAILRGGLFFAQGIYFQLGCRFDVYNPKLEQFIRPETKNVILVDSVINTGSTIARILKPEMTVACCVINRQAVELFSDQLYTVRVSQNSYVGTNIRTQVGNAGPDTTMRLFNQI